MRTFDLSGTLRCRVRCAMIVLSCSLLFGGWVGSGWAQTPVPGRPSMTKEQMDAFLADTRNTIMATIKRDGSPQLTPMWYRWDGERFWISTTRERAKYFNMQRDPRISLCIDDAASGASVIATGRAVLTQENLWAETQKITTRYRGAEGGAAYIKTMQEQQQPRVLVVLKPDKIIAWGPRATQ